MFSATNKKNPCVLSLYVRHEFVEPALPYFTGTHRQILHQIMQRFSDHPTVITFTNDLNNLACVNCDFLCNLNHSYSSRSTSNSSTFIVIKSGKLIFEYPCSWATFSHPVFERKLASQVCWPSSQKKLIQKKKLEPEEYPFTKRNCKDQRRKK